MWPFRRKSSRTHFSAPEVQAQADAIRAAWAEMHRLAKEGEAMGLFVAFKRDGIGDPYTGPRNFTEKLTITRSESL